MVLAVAIAGGAGAFLAEPLAAQRPVDGGRALWQRAVALAAQSSDMIPGAMTFKMREARPNGEVVQTQSARYVLDERPAAAVLRQVEGTADGVPADLEEDARPAAEVRPETPLDLPDQSQLTYEWLERAWVAGVVCERFTFVGIDEEGRGLVGDLCIDPTNAAPVEVRSTFDRLPPLVQELNFVMTFASYGDRWAPAEVITTGRAGLFGRRLFTVTFGFVDWRPPA